MDHRSKGRLRADVVPILSCARVLSLTRMGDHTRSRHSVKEASSDESVAMQEAERTSFTTAWRQ